MNTNHPYFEQIRKSIYYFYVVNMDSPSFANKYICDFDIIEKENELEISLLTNYPGIIIGKAGKDINALRKWVSDDLKIEKNIVITIRENKLWYFN